MTSSEEQMLANQATPMHIRGAVSAKDVEDYVKFLQEKDVLTRMVNDSFHIMETAYQGVDQDELQRLVLHHRHKEDDLLADMLQNVFLVGEGSSTFIASVPSNNVFVNVVLLYARRQDGKYDLLIAKGEQKKEVNMTKMGAAAAGVSGLGAGTAALAFGCGASLHPAVAAGAVVFLVAGCGAACKTYDDYNEPIENVVNGFLLSSLESKGLIEISHRDGIKLKLRTS